MVLINAKLFALMSSNKGIIILYPFFDKVQEIVKCWPPINRLKSIFKQLTAYPRQESLPRVPRFPIDLYPLKN